VKRLSTERRSRGRKGQNELVEREVGNETGQGRGQRAGYHSALVILNTFPPLWARGGERGPFEENPGKSCQNRAVPVNKEERSGLWLKRGSRALPSVDGESNGIMGEAKHHRKGKMDTRIFKFPRGVKGTARQEGGPSPFTA